MTLSGSLETRHLFPGLKSHSEPSPNCHCHFLKEKTRHSELRQLSGTWVTLNPLSLASSNSQPISAATDGDMLTRQGKGYAAAGLTAKGPHSHCPGSAHPFHKSLSLGLSSTATCPQLTQLLSKSGDHSMRITAWEGQVMGTNHLCSGHVEQEKVLLSAQRWRGNRNQETESPRGL